MKKYFKTTKIINSDILQLLQNLKFINNERTGICQKGVRPTNIEKNEKNSLFFKSRIGYGYDKKMQTIEKKIEQTLLKLVI
jgi:hypothetical protein